MGTDDSIGGPESSELLDLVRSAEEDAKLALRKRTPGMPTPVTAVPGSHATTDADEFVDVGDDAVDAPPSRPLPSAPPRAATARVEERIGPGLPPALGIALVFALAVAALALIAR